MAFQANALTGAAPADNKYDVFISFRGEDTRNNFTDHLFAALDSKRLIVFKDDKRLEKGRPIGKELVDAIRASTAAVVVFSRRYADSSWCLDELVEIVRCKEACGQRVVPVFCGVEMDDVRDQKGEFGDAFERHETVFSGEVGRVVQWRDALSEVARMDGWRLGGRNESEVVEEIAEELCKKLHHHHQQTVPDYVKGLVGMESRLEELISCLCLELDDVRLVGICGMGGIGKTTIARAIFQKLAFRFEGSSFLSDVREAVEKHGVEKLQQQLLWEIAGDTSKIWDGHRGAFFIRNRLRRKRVLIVIDNVDKLQILRLLAGKRDWFGQGSRILVTSRDKHLLVTYGVDQIYDSKTLNEDEGVMLLSHKAFKQNHPAKGFEQLSKKVVAYANGLPLALEILGSFLHKKDAREWEKAAKTLEEPLNAREGGSLSFQKSPQEKIFRILKLSYDGLDVTEQQMFLDIACYFTLHDVNEVSQIFESCDFYPGIGLNVLAEKCLITILSGRLYMHDLLNEMGRTLVYQECPEEPGKRSRLWSYNDIQQILADSTGTEAVEVIILSSYEKRKILMGENAFSRMTNLRILEIDVPHHADTTPILLSSKLRILKWNGYPMKALPQDFCPSKLFTLTLCSSRIQELSHAVLHSDRLKLIDLSHSTNLKTIPDFSGIPNLEKLILDGCKNLVSIHPSIGDLKKLVVLSLGDCSSLCSLPCSVAEVRTLRVLSIAGCSKLNQLPENVGSLECLEELDIRGTAVRKAPSSIVQLKNLKNLWLSGLRGEQPSFWSSIISCVLPGIGSHSVGFSLPSSFAGLQSLMQLDVSDCNLMEGAIPSDIGCLSALKRLNLSRNNFVSLPESIVRLSHLESLNLDYCERLEVLPALPLSIQKLDAHNCSSLTTISAPTGLSISKHQNFIFTNCLKLNGNKGHDNVAFVLLKGHLQLVGRITIQHFLTHCSKLVTSLIGNMPSLAVLQQQLQREIEAFPQIPSDIPRLVVQLSKCEIPDWFAYQTRESSVEIQLPKYWYSDATFMGVAFCAEFEVQKVSNNSDPLSKKTHMFGVSLQHESGNSRYIIDGLYRTFSVDKLAASDHLWLLYIPFNEFFYKRTWPSVVATFSIQGPYFKFKKTGARLVYLEDALQLDPMMAPDALASYSMPLTVYRQLLIPIAMEGMGKLGSIFFNFLQRNPQIISLLDQQNSGAESSSKVHQSVLEAGESSGSSRESEEGPRYIPIRDHRDPIPLVKVDD
uniref:ADP-ribosyl cyclase/cyclic ADP-ribose hydrolase n=1 Tax=Kalanchoe fedtschenkoi TaxID=63787 RepID=A0A7N0TVP5_KALFE